MGFIQDIFNKFFKNLFKSKKHIKLGLYGPPNAGKTTLANRICKDWLGETMGEVSKIPHETREIQIKEQIKIESKDGKNALSFNLVDTPGIATKIDYEDFIPTFMTLFFKDPGYFSQFSKAVDELISRVPSYTLEIGIDLAKIPTVIETFINGNASIMNGGLGHYCPQETEVP